MTPVLLDAFANWIPKGVRFNILEQPGIGLFLLLLVCLLTLLAGFYLALLLSAYKPVAVLKNPSFGNSSQSRQVWLRKTLTVSQFVIAQVFIIATLVVGKQINYSLHKDIGIKKDAVVYCTVYDTVASKKRLLMDKLKAIPGVAMASLSMDPPSSTSTWSDAFNFDDGKKIIRTDAQVKIGDSNYIKLYQIKLLAGRNISTNDSMGGLLINETFLHALGFTRPQDVIGRSMEVYGPKTIIGVVQDFHQKSLKEAITPLLITGGIASEYCFNIALQPPATQGNDWQHTMAQVQAAWHAVYPAVAFEYTFLDEAIGAYYDTEKNISILLQWATGLTIFISCLGLFGLVLFITQKRTKEIGVRKVIGATVPQIVGLLSKDFLQLIGVAFVIAVPIAWWAGNSWLQQFAYRTQLSWWLFAIGGIVLLVFALLVLATRTISAARANPVSSLRTE